MMAATYSGPIKAVIFDWAGTTVDHGSLAPVRVLQQVFARRDVAVSEQEARRDMGILKKDHIRKLLFESEVARRWRGAIGKEPSEADVESLFADFVPLQLECIVRYSQVIDGVAETVARLRERGIKIGSTTGYTRAMLDLILRPAAAQGYAPDCAITPDDVDGGRPYPWMIFENAIRLKVEPLEAIVKIGDTPVDIEEGLRAGVWTIGVACTGNMIGLSATDFAKLASAEKQRRIEDARAKLLAAGAHEVVDAVADCEAAINAIAARMQTT
jgi:phosphonoacetaldehyde hydrolase